MEPLLAGCLDPETRDALVHERLPPAEAARARAHVDGCATCRGLLELLSPTHGLGPGGAPAARTPTAIGRFRIVDRLGGGGMGVVFRAHDPQLDRQVAVKVMRPEVGDADGRERLLREARAQARLAHPNVVAIHEVGELDDGMFLAMELVEGTTLRNWLDQPRSRAEILARFAAAGRGLAAAHAAGLVHRDFKPDNVLCARDGRVQVADFGLARRQDAEDEPSQPHMSPTPISGSDTITRTGVLVGTPAYMAPELHKGERADGRSDQFAFAVALWHALTGAHPFGGSRDARVLAERVREGRRDARSAAALPRRLRRVLDRALASDPDHRFPTMDELLHALERPPLWRRNAVLLPAGAAVIAGGIAALVLAGTRDRAEIDRCRAAPDVVVGAWDEPTRLAVDRAIRATGLPFAPQAAANVTARLDAYGRDLAAMSLDSCEAHHVRRDQDAATYQRRQNCIAQNRRALVAVTTLLSAADRDVVERASSIVSSLPMVDLCRNLDALVSTPAALDDATMARIDELRAELSAGDADFYAARLDRAHARAVAVLAEAERLDFAPLRAEALYLRGASDLGLRRPEQAEDALYEAVTIAQAAGYDSLAAGALALLMDVVGVQQRRYDEADRLVGLARAAVDRLGPTGAHARLSFLRALADLRQEQGRYPEALATAQEALRVAEELGDVNSVDSASALSAIALAQEGLGKVDEARTFHLRALAMRERVMGAEHPDLVGSLEGLAIVHCRLERCAEGLPYLDRALRLTDRTQGADSHRRLTLLDTLGSIQLQSGRSEEAERAYRDVIDLAARRGWLEDPAVLRAQGNLALILRRSGRLDEAEALQRQVLAGKRKVHGAEHPSVGVSLLNLGVVLDERGKHADALATLQQAAALFEASVGSGHEYTANAHLGAAQSALGLRRRALARDHARRALAAAEVAHAGNPTALAEFRAEVDAVLAGAR